MRLPNIGGLLTTEVETVDLGEYAGHAVRGVVRRRTVRLGMGPRAHIVVLQMRPVAVEVDGARTNIEGASTASRRAMQRALLLLVLSIVIPRVLTRVRQRPKQEVEE